MPIGLGALYTGSQFIIDFLLAVVLLLLLYTLRDKIKLHPFHYSLVGLTLLAHNSGWWGTYTKYPFGLEFDFYLHFLSGLTIGLISYRFTSSKMHYSKKERYISCIIILLVLIFAHEGVEYAGGEILGDGDGVLFRGSGDLDDHDTLKDLINGFVGGIIALGGYYLYTRDKSFSKKRIKPLRAKR